LDRDENVRISFIQALCTLGAKAPSELLIKALYDNNWEIRRMVIKTLSLPGTKSSMEPLLATLGDTNSEVRKAVIQTLQKISFDALVAASIEATAILLEQGSNQILGSLTQNFVARLIGDMGHSSPSLLEKLTQLLAWPFWQVRVEACIALGKIRRNIPNTTIRRLLELRHDPQSQAVQNAADDALAEILSLETGIEDE
jgi:HEAT repeat protein